jgi:hypothetical protein
MLRWFPQSRWDRSVRILQPMIPRWGGVPGADWNGGALRGGIDGGLSRQSQKQVLKQLRALHQES